MTAGRPESGVFSAAIELDVGEHVDDEEVKENEREGVDLMLLVLLRSAKDRCLKMLRACVDPGADGTYWGTEGNASKMGDTCGSESHGTSEVEVDVAETGRWEDLVSGGGLDPETAGKGDQLLR